MKHFDQSFGIFLWIARIGVGIAQIALGVLYFINAYGDQRGDGFAQIFIIPMTWLVVAGLFIPWRKMSRSELMPTWLGFLGYLWIAYHVDEAFLKSIGYLSSQG